MKKTSLAFVVCIVALLSLPLVLAYSPTSRTGMPTMPQKQLGAYGVANAITRGQAPMHAARAEALKRVAAQKEVTEAKLAAKRAVKSKMMSVRPGMMQTIMPRAKPTTSASSSETTTP